MTIKTDVSRFHIHDELTAPDQSAPILKSIQTAGGAVSKFLGVLAESPAALRAYAPRSTRVSPPRPPVSALVSPSPNTATTSIRSPSTPAPPARRVSASTR